MFFMKIDLFSFIPLGLPIQILAPWTKNKKGKPVRNKLPEELGYFVNYHDLFYKQHIEEVNYAKRRGVINWSNIPLVVQLKSFKTKQATIWLRETGIGALQIRTQREENTRDLNYLTQIVKQMVKEHRGILEQQHTYQEQQIIRHVYRQHPQATKQINQILSFTKGKLVNLIFTVPENLQETQFLKQWIETRLDVLSGSTKKHVLPHNFDLRYHSRGFHALLIGDTTFGKNKKGRKIMKASIINALHLAYGIPLVLQETKTHLNTKKSMSDSNWDCLIHYLNPFVLGGKCSDQSIFGKGLSRSWFIRTDNLIKLRERYVNFFEELLQNNEMNHQLIIPLRSLVKLSTGSLITVKLTMNLPKTINVPQKEMQLAQQILQVLKKHEQDLLKEEPKKDLKYSRGLTVSQITTAIGLTNGRTSARVKMILQNLHQHGLVKWEKYIGKGRRNHSKMYYIATEYSNLQDLYKTVILKKLWEPLQELELEPL